MYDLLALSVFVGVFGLLFAVVWSLGKL